MFFGAGSAAVFSSACLVRDPHNLITMPSPLKLVLNAVDLNFAVLNRYLFPDSSKASSSRCSPSV
jgi:hypothetical protein